MSAYRERDRDLGKLLQEHRWKGGLTNIAIGAAAIIGPAVLFAASANEEWRGGLASAGMVLFAVLPVFGIYMFVDAYRMRSSSVRLHEEGIFHRSKGTVTQAHYEDVQAITSSVRKAGTTVVHSHRLLLADGTTLVVTNDYEDIDGLLAALHEHIDPLCQARVNDALAKGQRVAFGPLGLDGDSLSFTPPNGASTEVRLKELFPITLANGVFTVRTVAGQVWAEVLADQVPNALVFLNTANHHIALGLLPEIPRG